jgi:dipeptidyl aminopeptidase/acylaminoacyl peptidase
VNELTRRDPGGFCVFRVVRAGLREIVVHFKKPRAMTRSFLLCLLLMAGTGYAGNCGTGDPKAGDPKDSLTIEKALFRHNIDQPRLSPDGSKAVVVVSTVGGPPDSLVTHLWLLDTRTRRFRQFTSAGKSDNDPRWSPDGLQLAFLSSRNGSTQIFLIDMQGGEAMQLTQGKSDVRMFEWAPDGKSIAYVCQDEPSDSLKKRRDAKFDEHVVGLSDPAYTLYRIDVGTRMATPMLNRHWRVEEMKWLPSGKGLLLLVAPLPEKEMPLLRLVRFDPADSTIKDLAVPQHVFFHGFELSPDGNTAAFVSAREDGPTAHDLFLHRLDGNTYQNITDKTLDRIVSGYKFTDNHRMLGLVELGFDHVLYTIDDKGTAAPFGPKDNMQSFDASTDGTLVYVKAGFTALPELWLMQPGGVPTQVSDLNPSLAGIPLVTPKILTYKSFDGRSVEAALYLPAGSEAKTSISLVAFIHGGPTGAFSNAFSAWAQLLVQAGYAVFCPNVRGSTG